MLSKSNRSLHKKKTEYKEMPFAVIESQDSLNTHGLFKVQKSTLISQLLRHVVRAELAEAKEVIEKYPELLLKSTEVTDCSGRVIRGTALQIALGYGDSNVENNEGNIVIDGMVEMIIEQFHKLSGKSHAKINKIIATQYNEQFPPNYMKREAERSANDHIVLNNIVEIIKSAEDKDCLRALTIEDTLHQIIYAEKSARASTLRRMVKLVLKADSNDFEKAFSDLENYLKAVKIIQDDFDSRILKALYQFRSHLEPKDIILTSGKYFNLQLLVEASKCCLDNFKEFGDDPKSPKNIFIWQKILGYIQRFVPACDAQILAQGLLRIMVSGEKSERSLVFAYYMGGESKYFPFDSDPSWELGYNCAIAGRRGRAREGRLEDINWLETTDALKNLSRVKSRVPNVIMPYLREEVSKGLCLIL